MKFHGWPYIIEGVWKFRGVSLALLVYVIICMAVNSLLIVVRAVRVPIFSRLSPDKEQAPRICRSYHLRAGP